MDFAPPPLEAAMPATAQIVVLVAVAAADAALLAFAARLAWRERSALPVLYLVAGFCTVLLEPLIDVLGHGFHPVVGQIVLFRALGRSIPVHIGLVYTGYYGSMYLLMHRRLVDGGFTPAFVWKLFWITCGAAYVFEIVPVQIGLWRYYDRQALWIWRGAMPPYFVFANAASLLLPVALMHTCRSVLRGWGAMRVVVLSPMGAIMAHLGTGFPFYLATNSAVSDGVVQMAGALSIGLVLVLAGICARLLAGSRPAATA